VADFSSELNDVKLLTSLVHKLCFFLISILGATGQNPLPLSGGTVLPSAAQECGSQLRFGHSKVIYWGLSLNIFPKTPVKAEEVYVTTAATGAKAFFDVTVRQF
jgi:hypothetical protein